MKNQARALGYVVFLSLQDKEKCEKLTSLFNSDKESLTIACERGLVLTMTEMQAVSHILNKPIADLLSIENHDCYSAMVKCRGKTPKQSECEKMLNLIDSYIEIEEAAIGNAV